MDMDVLPVNVLGEFVAGVMRLTPKMRDAVCLRYEGFSYAAIGKKLGATSVTVESRIRRAIENWPELRELLPVEHIIRRESGRIRAGKVPEEPVGENAGRGKGQ